MENGDEPEERNEEEGDNEDTSGAEKEDAESAEEEDCAPAYIMHNRGAYYIPRSHGEEAGRVRDYNSVVEVDDATTLGLMHMAKNWPKDVSPVAVVVVKGVQDEHGTLSSAKNVGPYHWYARVGIRGQLGPDRTILRSIPKSVVHEFVSQWAKQEDMRQSTLIVKFQPHAENAKPLPVAPNGWRKVAGIKSAAVPQQRTKKRGDGDDPTAGEDAAPQVHSFKNHVPASKKTDKRTEHKKRAAEVESPSTRVEADGKGDPKVKAEVPKKMPPPSAKDTKPKSDQDPPKKGPLLRFVSAKTGTPPLSRPESQGRGTKRKEDAPAEASKAAPEKEGSAYGNKCTPDVPDLPGTAQVSFKRVRVVDCANRERTVTWWQDNVLYVAEH